MWNGPDGIHFLPSCAKKLCNVHPVLRLYDRFARGCSRFFDRGVAFEKCFVHVCVSQFSSVGLDVEFLHLFFFFWRRFAPGRCASFTSLGVVSDLLDTLGNQRNESFRPRKLGVHLAMLVLDDVFGWHAPRLLSCRKLISGLIWGVQWPFGADRFPLQGCCSFMVNLQRVPSCLCSNHVCLMFADVWDKVDEGTIRT